MTTAASRYRAKGVRATPSPEPVLVADLGGTNARCAVAVGADLIELRTYPTAAFSDLTGLLRTYIGESQAAPASRSACVAIAGPTTAGHARLTNVALTVDAAATRCALDLAELDLINDFAAIALSLPHLTTADVLQLGHCQADLSRPCAVIGPGTGLGVATRVPVGADAVVVPSEGGHAPFAPQTDIELEVVAYLRRAIGTVTAEKLLSGPGLSRLHQALAFVLGQGPRTLVSAAAVVEDGVHRRDQACAAALDLFCAMLGSFAATVALTTGAQGGVFLAGGILARFPAHLAGSEFRRRFTSHLEMHSYLEPIATQLITLQNPGLVGAAAWGRRRVDSSSARTIIAGR